MKITTAFIDALNEHVEPEVADVAAVLARAFAEACAR